MEPSAKVDAAAAAAAGPALVGRLPAEVKRILKVGNLPPSMTGDKLYILFGKFGALRQVRIGSDNETKGSAFIIYEDVYDAKRAMEALDGQQVGKGKFLSLEYFDLERYKKLQDRKRKRREAHQEFKERLGAAVRDDANAGGGSL